MSEGGRERLRAVSALVARGLPLSWAVLGVGIHVSTASRWRKREAHGELLVRRRGPRRRPLSLSGYSEAARLVRETHGLVGAEALRHGVPGLTRRAAAGIKSDTCRLMERERRQDAQRVTLAAPGIVRGFDAMELGRRGLERSHVLVAADGCVPFRTSWAITPRYDGRAVADILRRDFDTFGAPLVLRLDRATAHDVPAVRALLAQSGVLELHGPAYYARYYGQLERQNREHREWLATTNGPVDLDAMMAALNGRWRRSTLAWSTAQELWERRPVIHVDRNALAEEVSERATRVRRTLHAQPAPQDLAWRIAVKQALIDRGLLRVEKGGWC